MIRFNPAAWTALLLLLFVPLALPAEIVASVAKITGKAQIKAGDDWVPLSVGQKLTPGDTVSTGFRSELMLSIGPSTVTVKPLSRLTLQSLTQSGTDLQTDLYLKVGKVSAEVNKSEAVTTQKFKISSPIATASVRGTEFEFDTVNLQVTRGIVDFVDHKGNLVSIPVGEAAQAPLPDTNQVMATNQALTVLASVVSAAAGADFGVSSASSSSTDWVSWDVSNYWSDYGYNDYGSGYGAGATHVDIGGITPAPPPVATHFTIGGITPVPQPNSHFSIGGIGP